MKNVSKEMIIDNVASKTGLSKKDVSDVLTHLLDMIMDKVSKNQKVTFTGFGVFQTVKRKARDGVNPATGEPLKIPATKAPKFKAGKKFKDKVK